MNFYTDKLSPTKEITPEGYVIYRDVPLARTGIQLYRYDEILDDNGQPILKPKSGVIRVNRKEEEVFKPESMASFNGKPVVIEHPGDMVGPENWEDLAVGYVFDVRRGTGDKSQHLLGDVIVMAKRGIEATATLKEVSNGYECEYVITGEDSAEQINIIGNHVAFVPAGRCGGSCRISDNDIQEGQSIMAKKIGVKDFMTAFFKGLGFSSKAVDEAMNTIEGDEETLDEDKRKLIREIMAVAAKPSSEFKGGEEEHERTIAKLAEQLAYNPSESGGNDEAEKDSEGTAEDESETRDSDLKRLKELMAEMGPIMQRFFSEEEGEEAHQTGDEEGKAEKIEKEDNPGSRAPVGDASKVIDQETVGRAALIMKGFTATQLKSFASDCSLRRTTVNYGMKDYGHIIRGIVGDARPLDKCDCKTIDAAFMAITELARQKNNSKTADAFKNRGKDGRISQRDNFEKWKELTGNYWKNTKGDK